MANIAKEKTPKQKAAESATKALAHAKDAFEKSNNATTAKNLKDALAAANVANDAVRRERFTVVGRDRAELVSVKLAALSKCANKKSYEFTATDIDKIETVLTEDLQNTIASFRAALTGKAPSAKGSRLNFD